MSTQRVCECVCVCVRSVCVCVCMCVCCIEHRLGIDDAPTEGLTSQLHTARVRTDGRDGRRGSERRGGSE
jgi:hypothetical protein